MSVNRTGPAAKRARGFRGFRLAQREVVRSGRADTSRLTCRASLAGNGADPLCGDRATWMLTAGCPHEHVVPSLACEAHTEAARLQLDRGGIDCTPCAKGPDAHRCPVAIEFFSLVRS